jgi:hypothetical protein
VNSSLIIWIPDYFDMSDFVPSLDNISLSIDLKTFQNFTISKQDRIIILKFNETVNSTNSSLPVHLIITNLNNPIASIKTEYISKYGIFSSQFLSSYVKLTLYVAIIDSTFQE